MAGAEKSGLLGRVSFSGRSNAEADAPPLWPAWQRLSDAGVWLHWHLPLLKHQDDAGTLLLGSAQFGSRLDGEALAQWWQSYQQQGDAALAQLEGHFLALILDRRRQCVTLAVDRFSTIPLYYAAAGDGVALASHLPLLRHAMAHRPALSMQGIYHYLYFHMVPAPLSVWEGVRKIPAGHLLKISQGRTELVRYWRPVFLPAASGAAQLRTQSAAAALLVERLTAAVQRVGAERSATFLSGGLDSSTVTGLLSRQRDGDVDAYTVGFDAAGYDEMPYARVAARHFGVRHHELYLQPGDVAEIVPKIAGAYDEPFGNSSAVPTYFCAAAAAAAGHDTLLAGDGGDELFAGNARYAKQKLFEHYVALPGWLRAGIEQGVERLPALGQVPLIQKGYRYIEQARVPLPDRLESYNFFATHEPAQILHADLLAAIELDQPLKLLRDTYQAATADHALQRMLWLDWKQTLADNDLRKVSVMTQSAGIQVRYPMLDDALIDLALQLPPDWLLPGQKLRHFYKQAFSDFLPQQILAKPKHGFGLPFGVWMRDTPRLRELAYDALASLKRRALLRPDYLDRVVQLHQHDHAAYYGESIWIYMMLELWLQAWHD